MITVYKILSVELKTKAGVTITGNDVESCQHAIKEIMFLNFIEGKFRRMR